MQTEDHQAWEGVHRVVAHYSTVKSIEENASKLGCHCLVHRVTGRSRGDLEKGELVWRGKNHMSHVTVTRESVKITLEIGSRGSGRG